MKIIILRIVFLLLLCSTFFVIFDFSAQTGEESSGLSSKVTKILIDIFPNNLNEKEKTILTEKFEVIVRKLAHLTIYTLVGIFIMSFMCTFNIKYKVKIGTSTLVGLIYAITDEYHQSFVPDRGPSITDVCIDLLGVILGICLVICAITIYKKTKSAKDNKIETGIKVKIKE